MGLTRQQTVMVTVIVLGAFVAVLNQTLLTPALPTIMSHLSVDATTVQWLTSGYSMMEAIIIPLNAYLLGKLSTRKLYIGGISLFTVGSLICAIAPSFPFLFAGRLVQACATGVLMPTVFSLLLLIFPREQRGMAMGIIGLVVSFAPAIGPSISGVLVDSIGWRALFVLVACLSAIIIVISAITLKNMEGFAPTSFDIVSVILMAAGMVCLLYGLSTFTTGNTLVSGLLMLVGIAGLILFGKRQLKLEAPVLRVRVFRFRQFRVAAIVILLLEAVLISSGVILPMYIQNALGDTPTMSGILMFPGAALGAVCGLLAGKFFDKHGVRGIAVTGICVLLLGVGGYFTFTMQTPFVIVGAIYAVACIGQQMLITPMNTWGFNALPNEEIPHGNAIISTVEQVGASFGTAFAVSLTALYWVTFPDATTAAEQAFGGCHMAFLGIFSLVVVTAIIIFTLVKDKKPAPVQNVSETAAGEDRPWLVSDVMNPAPDILGLRSTVGDAIRIMQRTETSGLPIVNDDGSPAGFISDGDILKSLSVHKSARTTNEVYVLLREPETIQERLGDIVDKPALALATKRVISVDVHDTAEHAFRTLSEQRIKKVPVLRDGIVVGTLSRRNIMKVLLTMQGSL